MILRFAPSPTGLLHVGHARLALANWLLARRNGGRILLRLDDTETERNGPDFADAIQHDTAWLGLDWDETVRQSDRLDRYALAADKLRAAGRLYPCFESEEELNAKREQRQRRGLSTVYDRAMLKLTPEQRANAEAGGKRPYWRFMLSGVPAEWGDMVLGRREVKLSAVSDPVVIRADGTPLYLFTSVVDDLELGVTHIVRDEGHLTSTGMQIDMMAALLAGAPGRLTPPRFGHLPPLAEPGAAKPGAIRKGGRYSGAKDPPEPSRSGKRTATLSLRSLRADGIEPSALAGYLARLGTPEPAVAETPAQLAPAFDLTRVSRSSPRFDARQLMALNRQALQALPFDAVRDRLPPAATPVFWAAVRGGLDLLREARGWWDVVAGTIVPPLLDEDAEYLTRALAALPPEPWDDGTWPSWTAALKAETGRKGKGLLQPLRLALTGEDHGPDLGGLLPLMGRARVAERLRLAAA